MRGSPNLPSVNAPTPAEFAGLLARGSGRAHLILEFDDSGMYDDVLVSECLRNDPYDYQLEGGRAHCLHELADLVGVTDRVAVALVEALDGDDDYHIDYRFEMGAILAREGKPGLREAMWSAFERLVDRWSDTPRNGWPMTELALELIRLDGLPAVIRVCHQLGRLAAEGSDYYWDHDYLLSEARTLAAETAVDDALARERVSDPLIDAYLEAVEAEPAKGDAGRDARKSRWEMSWPDVRKEIERLARTTNESGGMGWSQWGKRASDQDLAQAAQALVDLPRDDPSLLRPYVGIFGRRTFPLDPGTLIALLDDPRDRVAWFAANALEQITHPSVRAAALRMAEQGPLQQRALDLLAANWEPGDEHVAERLLSGEDDRERLHSLGLGLRDVLKAHESRSLVPSLLLGYERTPCSLCRYGFVGSLIRLASLPDELRAECLWDADTDTRKLVSPVGDGHLPT
jgi:hypothetical protein